MNTLTTINRRNRMVLMADARAIGHRASYAWCRGSLESFSFVPTTKRQRLREPSHG